MMKKQFISAIQPGDVLDDIFIVSEMGLARKKDGNSYLTLVVGDKTGQLKAVAWDNVEAISAAAKKGAPALVQGMVSEYRGNLQLVVKQMSAVSPDEIDPSDFMPATQRDIEAMFDRLVQMTRQMKSDHLRALFDAFWGDEWIVERFKKAPAGKMMHHAYIGGLLEHVLSMVLLCDKIAGHYNGIDKDLLTAGAILHDMGKIRELDFGLSIDYSDEGRFVSHLVIGVQILEEKLKLVPDFPREKALLLKHMIVSHHGNREFGSPEPPKTIEAVMLHFIDEIDSKVNSIRDFMSEDSSDEPWTGFHRILGRHFYRGQMQEPSLS